MPKKKRGKKIDIKPLPQEPLKGQYYWCVNCGHHGDYGSYKVRNIKCEECGYDALAMYTMEEMKDDNVKNIWPERFIKKSKAKTESRSTTEKTVSERIAEIRDKK